MRSIAVIVVSLLMATGSLAQTRVVKGKLTTFNKFPVMNVTVESKKAGSTVSTDSLGQFELVCNEKDVIRIKTEVFEALSKKVNKDDDYLSANLIFRNSKKNRQIATGMGYISEENLTFALAHLADENINFCGYSDVFSLVQGKFSGVQIKSTGSGQGIFVRGQKSITGDNEAIYVVDGVRVADVSFVNPCEMASIDILKDGAAAMYGSQGANGVVIIETKGYKQQQSFEKE